MSAPRPALSERDVPTARRLRVGGHVQGVGFRPFVYRLARELQLTGSVRNCNGDVEIVAQGSRGNVELFARGLIERAPAIARAHILESDEVAPTAAGEFEILESAASGQARIHVPADYFTCAACLEELRQEGDRRYRYPFINCTQCGPRYTLIEALPYDRANTTMAGFELCAECRREYQNPSDRRFHAEPVACAVCGPRVWLEEGAPNAGIEADSGALCEAEAAIKRTVQLLRAGAIVAVKGIGGYHLLCDATNTAAVERLRERKKRPHKPLAVMFPQVGADGLDCVRSQVKMSATEAETLTSSARPIVLLRPCTGSTLPAAIAPGLDEVGVLLPYSPLHHLLLSDFGKPVVATSGNLSGEPVLTVIDDARRGLEHVADASLHHDRPISRPADDSVVRVTLGRPRVLRLGRGLTPRELTLPWSVRRPMLATGGHLKNTIALAWENRVVLSPHIADMGSVRSEEVFGQVVADLQRLYGVAAQEVICDAHPGYATSRWALRCGLPVRKVLHHHAHASALVGEHELGGPALVFTWDGVGLGEDRTLWGGETFVGGPGDWRRVVSFRPFRLPGGERAGRSPWRSAAALCWELGRDLPGHRAGSPDPLVRAAWERNVNCPQTSSVGRLFDAAAALALGIRETSYEGQGPMMLEAAAARAPPATDPCEPLPLYRDPDQLWRVDWAPLVRALLDGGPDAGVAAGRVHRTLAATIVSIALSQREWAGVAIVGLTGGVFQNALLTELAGEMLAREGFRMALAERVPCGDGGLSYGQVVEAIAACRRTDTSGMLAP
ncbi:MAG TPA: carbamoyltransferase HypF [Steroidobacteraceae bacterium]|nr:carbamoyltransferase HypF [Steroidobacteraceae bacterium]